VLTWSSAGAWGWLYRSAFPAVPARPWQSRLPDEPLMALLATPLFVSAAVCWLPSWHGITCPFIVLPAELQAAASIWCCQPARWRQPLREL
jgi:hypothetical protein